MGYIRKLASKNILRHRQCLNLDFPVNFYIETTSACNLKCPDCVRTYSSRPSKHISESIFRKALQEISTERPNLRHLGFHFFGEALLNPQFFDLIEQARNYLPKTNFSVSSNALFLDSNKIEKLLNSSMNQFLVCPDSVDSRLYDEIRTGGSLEKVEYNVNELLERRRIIHKEDIEINIYSVLHKNNFNSSDDFIRKWRPIMDKYQNVRILLTDSHDWAGQVPSENVRLTTGTGGLHFKVPCFTLFTVGIVTAEGEMTPCFFDCNLKLSLGNIADDSIKNMWNGKKATELRERMINASMLPTDLCSHCHCYNVKASNILRIPPHYMYNWRILHNYGIPFFRFYFS